MKRFLIDTSVENAEGTQTWFVDAETEEEALDKFSAGGCDLYESNVDVTQCGEPEISGEVPLDDFGRFADQPPAAQKAIEFGMHGKKMMATPKTTTTAPTSWMEMVTANLVREGVNKHKARELAEHFYHIAAAQPATCTWTKSPDPHMPDTFNATCGVVWTFTDGGPAENDVRFCPGCGADVSVAAPEPEKDLYDLAVKADNGGQP